MSLKRRQADLQERAAKCERASEAAIDPPQKAALMILHHLWANLADQCPSMTELQLMREISAIEQIHAAAFGPGEDKAAE